MVERSSRGPRKHGTDNMGTETRSLSYRSPTGLWKYDPPLSVLIHVAARTEGRDTDINEAYPRGERLPAQLPNEPALVRPKARPTHHLYTSNLAIMDTADADQDTSPATSMSESVGPIRRNAKRDRVSLACQRCQRRKQRCDGREPCTPCNKYGTQCNYVAPRALGAGEKKEYVKALEQRVADLESQLASFGQPDANVDHFQTGSTPAALSDPRNKSLSGSSQHADEEPNDIFIAVRDLSLSASGHYVGATSSIGISRVLASMLQSGHDRSSPDDHDDNPAPKSAFDQSRKVEDTSPLLARDTIDKLKKGWFAHIATRYPFLHTPYVLFLFRNQQNLVELYDKCMLSLICAVSGRWLESAGEMGYFYSEQHYETALKHMDDILHLKGQKPIDYLLLLALYCTRAPKNPGAWTYIGAAMRLCIELGLHRAQPRQPPSITRELEKRKFWTAYSMDRDVCIAIGRPPSISDHDIDAEMPLELDEAEIDERVVQQVSATTANSMILGYSTLTPFIHRLRLKHIESKIQHVAYRVDKPEPLSMISVDSFLHQLEDWYRRIPPLAKDFDRKPDEPYDGIEFYTIHYHRCIRLLLYPQLSVRPLNLRYVEICARASAGVIVDYRQLHRRFPVGFSAMSIQSVFLSGLTLIYCAWLSSLNILPDLETTLTDCQLLLYIIAERYPSSRKYRDLFEKIKSALMSEIANGKQQVNGHMQLGIDMQENYRLLDGCFSQHTGDEFTQMLYDMTGQLPDPLPGFANPYGITDQTFGNKWWPT